MSSRYQFAGPGAGTVNFVVEFVFLVTFRVMMTSFVLLSLKILHSSPIFSEHQRTRSIKQLVITQRGAFERMKDKENFINYQKLKKWNFISGINRTKSSVRC